MNPPQDLRTHPRRRVMPTYYYEYAQDWILLGGSQTGGFTILEFTRLIDTGDTAGDRVIGQVKLLWHHCQTNVNAHYMYILRTQCNRIINLNYNKIYSELIIWIILPRYDSVQDSM